MRCADNKGQVRRCDTCFGRWHRRAFERISVRHLCVLAAARWLLATPHRRTGKRPPVSFHSSFGGCRSRRHSWPWSAYECGGLKNGCKSACGSFTESYLCPTLPWLCSGARFKRRALIYLSVARPLDGPQSNPNRRSTKPNATIISTHPLRANQSGCQRRSASEIS